jgi:amino acid adenylation domain-containing protein
MLTAAIPEPMSAPEAHPPVPAAAVIDTGVLAFPASVAQQMFWYMEMLQGNVTAFNVPLRFSLTGPLDMDLFDRALNAVIQRHESLRTHFEEENGELMQIVSPQMKLPISYVDISHFPADRIREEADRLGSIEANRSFRLAVEPLMRAEILRLGHDHHYFHFTVHHALFDGMSMAIFGKELAEFYQAFFENRPPRLEPLAIQYGDYSVWQKEFLQSPKVQVQIDYWKNKLKGMTEVEIPTDFPRPPLKTWRGDITSILLPKPLSERLQTIAAEKGATLFHIHLAAFMLLLRRYSGNTDIAVGAPVFGRNSSDLEPLIGVFINTLILRGDLSGNPTFFDYLERIRTMSLEAFDNQDLPFERLVHELAPPRDPSRNPLFQINFNHHRSFTMTEHFGGVDFTTVPSRSGGSIFDMHIFFVEREEGWRASLDYCTDLFTRETMDRMLGNVRALLEDIANHPEKCIEELEILPDSEKQQLHDWSRHTRDYPRDATIGSLFLGTSSRHAERTALVCGDRSFTYQQLRAESTRLAATLIQAGVKPGDTIAICAEPGPEMIKGFLAILLAGGCCVPIDMSYPADRIALLLDDCGAMTALATTRCAKVFPASWKGRLHDITAFNGDTVATELPDVQMTAEDPAYLLFTSGSTGRPKGVLLPHRGTVRLVRDNDFITITPDDVFLQAAPVSFDASLLEIWGALLNGGRLVLLPDGPGLEGIATAVRDHGVTTLWLTSGLFQLMIEEHADSLKGLRHLLAGGDVLSTAHVRMALDALPATKLINGYGPTENTTFTTCHAITREDLTKSSIPIGRPVANTTVHLLDERLRQVPTGMPGELCTGGDGLAIGYLNAPDLSAAKFITHPEFGRLYRTGDLCRMTADGSIEFLGRNDQQVKVRGFRIELGEIEAILASHPKVIQCKAAVRGDSAETKRIFAWAVPADISAPTPEELAAYLAKRLPGFMHPDGIAVIDAFPLNANGKIQLASLPDPGHRAASAPQVSKEAPVGDAEIRLAAIWEELLDVSGIGRDDDFFALGGHSLLALRMFSRINREFQKSLPLAMLIQHPTIAKLATVLAPPPTARPAVRPLPGVEFPDKGNVVTLAEGSSQRPLFCIHGGDGGVLFYRSLAALMPRELPIHAIESLELSNSGKVEECGIEETAAAYVRKILAIQQQGPFRLAGYSFGGVVAHEIACLLTYMGHQVEFLGMFDTHNPASSMRYYGLIERLSVFWKQSAGLPLAPRIGLLKSRIAEGIHTNRRIRSELKAAMAKGPATAYSDLRRVQVREENWRAMLAYRPKPFAGRITLFKTTHVNDKYEFPADYGWGRLALAGLDIIPVQGEHLALFSTENVTSLAAAVRNALDATGGDS